MKKIKVNIILIAYTKIFLLTDVKQICQTFNRKLNPVKERRPWSLLEKNPISAELMHIYLNTFPWPTSLCFYGYQDTQ
jgi:hypothetical protein